MPDERKTWARAMQAELAEVKGNYAKAYWIWGCLYLSYFERVRSMRNFLHNAFDYAFGITSIVFGIFFTVPGIAYVLHLSPFYAEGHGALPFMRIGMTIIGVIELVGGINQILHRYSIKLKLADASAV